MKQSHFFGACVAALLVALCIAPVYHLGLLAFAGIDALAAVGLVLLMRAGQVSLGQAAFIGLGAYAAAFLSRDAGLSPWLSLPLGALVAALAAAPLGAVTLRLRGTYLPLATLAWGIAIYVIFMASPLTGGSSGMDRIPPLSVGGEPLGSRGMAFLVWALVLAAVFGASRLLRSRAGRAMRTLEEHDAMAVSFGVDVSSLKKKVFILSAGLAGLAGALYAYQTNFISPTPFGIGASFTLLIIVMLGGVSHPVGAAIGAVLLSAINLTLQSLFSGFINRVGPIEPVIFGALLVILLLRWPGGLWSALAPWLRTSVPQPETSADAAPRASVKTGSPAHEAGQPPLLELIDVDKHFGGIKALTQLSLKIPKGQVVGLIGPNGAGKSTAFNLMSGLSSPSRGEVCMDGASLPEQPHEVVAHGLARTFQHVKLVGDMTVLDNVAIGAYWQGHAGLLSGMLGLDVREEQAAYNRAWQALRRVGLDSVAATPAGSLPLGKQRLVEIARALTASPSLLLLDEPAAGLRASEKTELVELVRKLHGEGVSIVLVEHDMRLVMTCVDHLIVLNRGQMLSEGSPDVVRRDPQVIQAYLGAGA